MLDQMAAADREDPEITKAAQRVGDAVKGKIPEGATPETVTEKDLGLTPAEEVSKSLDP